MILFLNLTFMHCIAPPNAIEKFNPTNLSFGLARLYGNISLARRLRQARFYGLLSLHEGLQCSTYLRFETKVNSCEPTGVFIASLTRKQVSHMKLYCSLSSGSPLPSQFSGGMLKGYPHFQTRSNETDPKRAD